MVPPPPKCRVARPIWAENKVPAPARRLLDDDPNTPPEIKSLFEQGRIVDEIERVIASFLDPEAGPKCDERRSLFLALHGRFGQGKSRVINELCDRLNWHRVSIMQEKNLRSGRGVRVVHFQCSYYKPEDLRQNFDYFMEGGRTYKILLFYAVIWLLAGSLLKPGLDLLGAELAQTTAYAAALLGFAAMGLGSLRYLMRDVWRMFRIGRKVGEIFGEIGDRLFVSPDVVIVDDLDRASVQQQAELLLSLTRHRAEFQGVLLAAFDDAALLGGASAGSAEILIKAFDASFRLAPMNAQDAGVMAAAYGVRLAKINPECELAQRFRHPFVCGALARVFILHGNASARFAKKLVNNVYSGAALAGYRTDADIVALIRLHGIFQYLPLLETQLDQLADSLLNSADDALAAEVRRLTGRSLADAERERVSTFLRATRHMQPGNLSWMRLLRMWRDPPANRSPLDQLPTTWTWTWAANEALLTTTVDPSVRLELYRQAAASPGDLVASDRELRLDDMPMTEADKRPKAADREIWHAMIAALQVFDDEVLALLPDHERDALIVRHRRMVPGSLMFSRKDSLRFGDVRSAFRHSLSAPDRMYQDRLRHELKLLLEDPPTNGISSDIRLVDTGVSRLRAAAIDDVWPDFVAGRPQLGRLKAQEEAHFRVLGVILQDLTDSQVTLPLAHRHWFAGALRQERHLAVLRALHCIIAPTPGRQADWRSVVMRAFWNQFDSLEQTAEFQAFLAEALTRIDVRFLEIWAVAFDPQQRIDPATLALNLPPTLLPQAAGFDLPEPEWLDAIDDLANQWPALQSVIDEWRAHWRPIPF